MRKQYLKCKIQIGKFCLNKKDSKTYSNQTDDFLMLAYKLSKRNRYLVSIPTQEEAKYKVSQTVADHSE